MANEKQQINIDALKPCPFCGGKAVVLSGSRYYSNDFTFYATCLACGVETPRTSRTIESAHTAWNRRQSSWIPVTERLPEKDGKYLVAIKYGDGYVVSTRKFRKETSCWWAGASSRWERRTAGVRYWMPLPEMIVPVTIISED